MKIAITGASGQLGGVVLERLLDDRKVKSVVAIDRAPARMASPKLVHIIEDVRSATVGAHFTGCDVVVHCAFLIQQARTRGEYESVNIGGSRNVFECAARAGVRQIVYSSSVAAYGVVPGHPDPIVEDTERRYQPEFGYAATKYDVERFLDGFEREHPDIAVVRVRPGILFGAHMEHTLGPMLRRGNFLGVANESLPIVWDEDVADAMITAIRTNARGAFNLVAAEPLTPREMARAGSLRFIGVPRALARFAAQATQLLSRVGLARAADPAWIDVGGVHLRYSCDRARRDLGWKPRCATSADVMRRHADVVPRKTDPRIRLFLKLSDRAARKANVQEENRRVNLVAHLQLTGRGGGDFTLEVREGRFSARAGAPRPPQATVTLAARQFLDLLAGKTDLGGTMMTNRVRVRGEATGILVLQGLVNGFRAQVAKPTPDGRIAARLAAWFAKA